jgi:hypothetical protein
MDSSVESTVPRRELRVNGIVVLVAMVVAGMGIGAVWYHWKAPALIAERRAQLAAAPKEGEPRLAQWLELALPDIHQRLLDLRISARQPWLVTHVVLSEREEGEPEVWGLDFSHLPTTVIAREGMVVRITLPEVRALARATLAGDKARYVKSYCPGDPIPAPDRQAETMIEYVLRHPGDGGGLIGAMERDIPGSSLRVSVGGATAAEH